MSAVSYIAVDLETTGLDPVADAILEIAWAPLDFRFNPIIPVQSAVVKMTPEAGARLAADEYVMNMHARNGLVLESGTLSQATLGEVEGVVLDSLRGCDFSVGKPTIFGSSVHFDLRFIDAQMPTLRKLLHYRVFDVSTLLAFAAAADLYRVDGRDVAHRAAADIQWSIDTARDILARTPAVVA